MLGSARARFTAKPITRGDAIPTGAPGFPCHRRRVRPVAVLGAALLDATRNAPLRGPPARVAGSVAVVVIAAMVVIAAVADGAALVGLQG